MKTLTIASIVAIASALKAKQETVAAPQPQGVCWQSFKA